MAEGFKPSEITLLRDHDRFGHLTYHAHRSLVLVESTYEWVLSSQFKGCLKKSQIPTTLLMIPRKAKVSNSSFKSIKESTPNFQNHQNVLTFTMTSLPTPIASAGSHTFHTHTCLAERESHLKISKANHWKLWYVKLKPTKAVVVVCLYICCMFVACLLYSMFVVSLKNELPKPELGEKTVMLAHLPWGQSKWDLMDWIHKVGWMWLTT